MNKSILEVVHESARDLRDAGAIGQTTMREFDALCLSPVYLNTSPSTVQKWEQGKKRPRGASLKLLNLVDRKGIDALA